MIYNSTPFDTMASLIYFYLFCNEIFLLLGVPHFFTTPYVTQRRSASGAEESIIFTN